jgi:hypothetical protein
MEVGCFGLGHIEFDPPDVQSTFTRGGSESVMAQVTSELRSIAAVIEVVTKTSTPSFDLLEISRAIQTALVLLNDWRDP